MGVLTVIMAIAVISLMAIKRINIGLAMLAGSAVLVIFTPVSLDQTLGAVKRALFDPETLVLMGAVLLIGVFGYVLKNSGAMEDMVESLVGLVGDSRWVIASVAGLLGALTVPGGSMLTAPMVDQLGDRVGMGPEYKTGVNIVFRHVWYVFLPIIPSMLTAANLAGTTPKALAWQNLPALLAGLTAAWFLLLHPLPKGDKGEWGRAGVTRFLNSVLPLLLVIFLYIGLGLPFLAALALGIFLALFSRPEEGEGSWFSRILTTGSKRLRTMLLPGVRLQLALAVAGVMIFKELLAAGGLINGFAANLVGRGFPLWLLLTVLPLFIGLATGFHEAAIGIAIPIFLPLLSPATFMTGVSLVYVAATIGYILSPLHLCVILTREYFQARFAATYRYLLPTPLFMLALTLIWSLVKGL